MSLVNDCLKIAANDALSSFETSLKRQKIGHPLRGRQTTIAVGGKKQKDWSTGGSHSSTYSATALLHTMSRVCSQPSVTTLA